MKHTLSQKSEPFHGANFAFEDLDFENYFWDVISYKIKYPADALFLLDVSDFC